MKTTIPFVLISLLMISSTCNKENCHETITFYNNSDKDLYVMFSTDYPDTLSYQYYSGLAKNARKYKVNSLALTTSALRVTPNCWEAVIRGERTEYDTLMVFVFDAEHIENFSWTEVTARNLVLKRYDLSLGDLQSMNWIIQYP